MARADRPNENAIMRLEPLQQLLAPANSSASRLILPITSYRWPAGTWRVTVQARIACGSLRMPNDAVGRGGAAGPADSPMVIAFCEVEHRGLAGKES